MPTILFDTLWNTLRDGKVWTGKIKNKKKNGDFYFVNSHIFPIYDTTGETVLEYMAVRFLITDEEVEKRDFKKKVIQSMKDSRLTSFELKSKVAELELQLSLSNDIKIVFETLNSEKRKNANLLNQINHYEKSIEENEKVEYENKVNSKKDISELIDKNRTLELKNYELLENINSKDIEIHEEQELIQKLNKVILDQNKRLEELEDVVSFQDSKLNPTAKHHF